MGAPVSDVKAAEAQSAESLLESFKSIDAAERRRHASVLNYWLSIKGDKDVAPIRDLDPLEISDAGPDSLLLELIGGGEDAEIKHSGDALKAHADVFRISEAARPSLLASIGGKLAITAISRNFLAFEDSFATADQEVRCWVTLLPFSSTGVWVDYVYAFVTLAEGLTPAAVEAESEAVEDMSELAGAAVVTDEVVEEPAAEVAEKPAELPDAVEAEVSDEVAEAPVEDEPVAEFEQQPMADLEQEPEPVLEIGPEPEMEIEEVAERKPGFSKIFDALTNFHGTSVKAEPKLPVPPAIEAEEAPLELEEPVDPVSEPKLPATAESDFETVPEEPIDEAPGVPVNTAPEGILQSKLEEVRAKADEARLAKLRSNLALYEGLGAAYDFALDAEASPEEYLRMVEAKGLKIQLRSPMTPVVKLAFDGMCDDSMIGQLEAVLAWALKNDLPRGTLADRIEAAGGIAPLLNGQSGQAEAA